GTAQREAYVAVYQCQRQAALQRTINRGAQFRARLDAVLLGQAHLISTQRQAGGHHRDLAVLHYAEQIEPAHRVRIEHGALAAFAQLNRHFVETARFEQGVDCPHTGWRYMRRAEQHDLDTTDAQHAVGLGNEDVLHGGWKRRLIQRAMLAEQRTRLSRKWVARFRLNASGMPSQLMRKRPTSAFNDAARSSRCCAAAEVSRTASLFCSAI